MLTVNGTEVQHVYVNQQAVNYMVKDGKLVWADPAIYLQSTSSVDTYIDTGLKAQNFSEIACTYQIVGTNAYVCVFGGRQGTKNNEIDWRRLEQRYKCGYGTNSYYYTPASSFFDKHTVRYSEGSVYLDGTIRISNITQTAFTGTKNVYLFGMNDNGEVQSASKAALKIHNAKFYIDNNLVRDFVPVPTGLVIGNFTVPSNGMFDIVNQQFYANQGTGEFAIGMDE